MSYLQTIMNQTAGHADGLNLGVLQALAERVESDLGDKATAGQLGELHDKFMAIGVVRARACSDYDHAFATAYSTGYATFNRPMTVEQACDVFKTVVPNLFQSLAL